MSSTLTVTNLTATNLTDGGGTTSTFANVASGTAKAWVNFDGTGTIAARDSFNVSSLTDNGTGNHDMNFASNMGNSSYSTGGSSADIARYSINHMPHSNRSTTSLTTQPLYAASFVGGGTVHDASDNCLQVFGDLA
tara:strand:- start:32 stop:439 length:408 start_codon:yes stop_codon:yes gene_type:complete